MERPIVFFPSAFLVILMLTMACGVLALSGADVVNPIHSFLDYQKGMVDVEKQRALNATRIQIEQAELWQQHQHNQEMRELEFQNKVQELEFQQQRRAAELAHFERLNRIKEALLEFGGKALISLVIAVLFIMVSSRSVVHTLRSLRREGIQPPQTPRRPTEEEKRALIQAARAREQQERLQKIRERERVRQDAGNDHKQAATSSTVECYPEDIEDYGALSLAV